jgi:dTDP-4-amino-4,6-dideoxygalactose transaminase
VPAHWHPVFADLGHRRGEFPVAEQWYRQEISLPLFVGLSDADVDRVCDLVRGFFRS